MIVQGDMTSIGMKIASLQLAVSNWIADIYAFINDCAVLSHTACQPLACDCTGMEPGKGTMCFADQLKMTDFD